MIKNIIFDFGKVLVDYDFGKFLAIFRAYAPDDAAFEEFKELMLRDDVYDRFDRGTVPFAECIAQMQQENPRCAAMLGAFDTRFSEVIIGEVEGMRELMISLKANGYRLLGLSNWSEKVYPVMKEYPDIFSLLDDMVISCEVKYIKPEPEIYHCALKKFGIEASESVFIDDKAVNIAGSKAVGIDGVVFTDTESLKAELAKRGVKF